MMGKSVWTEHEDESLKQLIQQGLSIHEMARIHKRTREAIRRRLYLHKTIQPTTGSNESEGYQFDELNEKDNKEMEGDIEPVTEERVKPYITIFDTETTALAPDRAKPHQTDAWERCRVVQVAWEKYTHEGQLVEQKCVVVQPSYEFESEAGALEAHGITREKAMQGITHDEYIQLMCNLLDDTEILVAHNIHFDVNVTISELYRSAKGRMHVSKWNQVYKECTHKMATNEFGYEKNDDNKLPHVYHKCKLPPLDNITLHQADDDVRLCSAIYFHLRGKVGTRMYLNQPFCKNAIVKRLGGIYDPIKIKWFIYDTNPFREELVKLFS
jgi:DNA polymerase III epsilon subunit-like protein